MPKSKIVSNVRRQRRQRPSNPAADLIVPRNIEKMSTSRNYTMRKKYQLRNIASVATGFIGYGFNFRLADLPLYTEMQALFDQYRIIAVEVEFVPAQTESINVTDVVPRIYHTVDFDNATIPPNLDVILDYQRTRMNYMTQYFKRSFKPCSATNVFSTGSAPAYSVVQDQWIDILYPTVEYYGLKVGIDSSGATIFTYQPTATVYIELRNVR
jgi:hypothetical protein